MTIPIDVYGKLKNLEAENIGLREDLAVKESMLDRCMGALRHAWLELGVIAIDCSTGMST